MVSLKLQPPALMQHVLHILRIQDLCPWRIQEWEMQRFWVEGGGDVAANRLSGARVVGGNV